MIKYKRTAAIGLIWLFHISGIIGMAIGFEEWFISKTPLNLLISFIILLLVYPIDDAGKGFIVFVFFIAGFFVEWVGVTYGFLFGEYRYGENLGLKMDGIPFMMGITWAMLVLITGTISSKLKVHYLVKSMVGSTLMVFLDFFIEPSAPTFDFWYWSLGYPPVQNYIAWFFIAFFMHILYHKNIKTGNLDVAVHLYAAQLIFFAFFYVF